MAWVIIGYGPTGYPIYGDDGNHTPYVPPALPPPAGNPPAPPLPPAPSPIDPKELAATLYDKYIPAIVSDQVEVGGRLIEGPDFSVINNETVVSYTAGFYIPMNYWDNTRTATQLSFRGKTAWTLTGGALMSGLNVNVATTGGAQTVRFNTGTLGQAADAWSVGKYGSSLAIGYGPLVTATCENIRIKQFDGFVPFTSIKVADTAFGTPGDGVAWSDVLTTLARYAGRAVDEFEAVNVSGAISALILGTTTTDMDVFQGLRKLFPNWSLRTGRKLYVVEKGLTSVDLTVSRDSVLAKAAESIVFSGIDPFDKPVQMKANYLNTDRDYEPDYVIAKEDTFPVPSSDSYQQDNFSLPIATTPNVMISQLNFAYYNGEMARTTAEFTGMAPYYGLECGDTLLLENEYQRINEIVRKVDWTIEVKTEGFLTCAIASNDTNINYVILLMGADSAAIPDESPADNGDAIIFGSAVKSSAHTLFGTSSLRIPDGSSFVAWPGGIIWRLAAHNTDTFTIEATIYLDSIGGLQVIVARYSGLFGRGFKFAVSDSDLVFQAWSDASGAMTTGVTTSGITLMAGQQYAVAVDHDNTGVVRLFVDGVMCGKDTPVDSTISGETGTSLTVGADALNNNNLIGYIDEVRITKGAPQSRYPSDSNYDIATSKFPRI